MTPAERGGPCRRSAGEQDMVKPRRLGWVSVHERRRQAFHAGCNCQMLDQLCGTEVCSSAR